MQAELFFSAPGKGEQAKQKLLLAALEKIGEKGYENASVREIAVAAGQNVAAIAYYFGNKEKLYQEVIAGIVSYLQKTFGPVAKETRDLLETGQMDARAATDSLKRLLKTLLLEHIERSEIGKLRNVMMREQAAPSECFECLYSKGIKPLHELFTKVLCIATGEEPGSAAAIIRAHAIFGQIIGFTVARSTILRRLGVKKLDRSHGEIIARILDEHIEIICSGFLNSAKTK
jgi:TetR/AcrR family transcriptional regulator, regulator of cefoperazone and chloramphenicol sensitivity